MESKIQSLEIDLSAINLLLDSQSKTLEKLLEELHTATSTAWALDVRIYRAHTILKSVKDTTKTLVSHHTTPCEDETLVSSE